MPHAPRLLFGLHLLSTLSMLGIIWFVQVVHYPLFAEIEPSVFPHYETAYANRMGYFVGPIMLVELLSALALLSPSLRLPVISTREAWCGAALLGLIWASTAFLQVPLHNQLHRTYDPEVIRRLVASNWIRTLAWTLRSALVLLWVNRLAGLL